MTADQFNAWLKAAGLTQRAAAEALGVSANAVTAWVKGRAPIDKRTALACAAVFHRLDPWA